MRDRSRTLIVGPNPINAGIGGVVNHIRILKKLPSLRDAIFWDPGSINNFTIIDFLKIIKNCLLVRNVAERKDCLNIWMNVSIYPLSLIKMLIILVNMLLFNKSIKIRVFFHGGRFNSIWFFKLKIFIVLFKPFLRRVHSFHFLSKEQGDEFAQIFPSLKWVLFSNYLPFNTLLTKEKTETFNLLFVGRMVREKGIFEILEAYEMLLQKTDSKSFLLWYAGDGPEFNDLERIANQKAFETVKLWGKLDQERLFELYSKSSLLLLPTYHPEGFPYVVIEAMRSGLPIISTPSGILQDLLSKGSHGILVPPKKPEDLCTAILKIINDRKLYNQFVQENQRYYKENLSLSAAEKYYRSLLFQ